MTPVIMGMLYIHSFANKGVRAIYPFRILISEGAESLHLQQNTLLCFPLFSFVRALCSKSAIVYCLNCKDLMVARLSRMIFYHACSLYAIWHLYLR